MFILIPQRSKCHTSFHLIFINRRNRILTFQEVHPFKLLSKTFHPSKCIHTVNSPWCHGGVQNPLEASLTHCLWTKLSLQFYRDQMACDSGTPTGNLDGCCQVPSPSPQSCRLDGQTLKHTQISLKGWSAGPAFCNPGRGPPPPPWRLRSVIPL